MHFSKLVTAVALWASCSSAAPHSPLQSRQGGPKFAYGDQKVRGVNLGGVSCVRPDTRDDS